MSVKCKFISFSQMLFLILICLSVATGLASPVRPNEKIDIEYKIIQKHLGSCDAHMAPDLMFKSIGINPNETYLVSDYAKMKHFDLIDKIFWRDGEKLNLTLNKKISLLKEQFPELTREIDLYGAFTLKGISVILLSVFEQLGQRFECIYEGKCQLTDISNEDAMLLMGQYFKLIIDTATTIGHESITNLKEKFEIFDRSKFLNLTYHTEYVYKQYTRWIDQCQQESLPTTTTQQPEIDSDEDDWN